LLAEAAGAPRAHSGTPFAPNIGMGRARFDTALPCRSITWLTEQTVLLSLPMTETEML